MIATFALRFEQITDQCCTASAAGSCLLPAAEALQLFSLAPSPTCDAQDQHDVVRLGALAGVLLAWEFMACVVQERLAEERAKKDAQVKEAAAARKTTDNGKPDERDRRTQNGEAGRDAKDRGRDGRERSDRDRAEQSYRARDRDRMPGRSDR